MIRQFGMYPRFFVKKRNLLDPLIEKYTGSTVKDKSKGQVMKLYFNLLRGNSEFRAEVDTLIEQQGSKLLTIQDKIAGKRSLKAQKKENNKETIPEGSQANFCNAEGDITPTDLSQVPEADFFKAIADEEAQETTSSVIKIGGLILIGWALWYGYKHYIK